MSEIEQSKIRNFVSSHISIMESRHWQIVSLRKQGFDKPGDAVPGAGQYGAGEGEGITIKAQAVRTVYKARMGKNIFLILMDTPGHVDFNYEDIQKSCGVRQRHSGRGRGTGVEAQTLANVYLALDHDLDVMPVINKIDLPSADPDQVKEEIEDSDRYRGG